MLLIADKYAIMDLVRLCEEMMPDLLTLENAIQTFVVADRVEAKSVKNEALAFIGKNVKELIDTPMWNEVIASNPALVNLIFKEI